MSYRIDLSSASTAISSIGMDEINGTHAETLNDIDYLDFTLYINSSEWSDCSPNLTYIDLYSSIADGYLFNGRVISVIDDLAEEGLVSKKIHCESEIAYLCDSVCDVQDVLKQMEDYHSYTPGDTIIAQTFIVAMLELHAKTVDAKRRIYPPTGTWNSGGYFEISGSTGYPMSTINDSLNIDTGSTFSVLKSLRDKLGYDIWCEHTDGKAYLRVGLAGSRESGTSGFNIVLSKNMRSLTVERAPVNEGRITRICPLGGVGADGKRLNIASVNNYSRYLENSALVAIYGNIDMVVLYDDLVDDGNLTAAQLTAVKNELKSRGQQRLNLLTGGITGIRCRAVDLYELGMRLDADHAAYPFKVGGLYGFDCSIFGITDATQFRLFSKTTDLGAPYDPELTFVLPSATYKTQVTNERLRIQQKFYAQAKAQADRMDSTSIKRTTSAAYDPTTANPDTVYYVDKGDGTGELMLDGTSYGGGGSATTVENATILDNSNFHDYNIVERMDIAVTPAVNLYYGNLPNFVCVQGNFMLYLAAGAQTVIDYDNGYIIDGDPTLYGRIIANKDKFGCQIGTDTFGGFLHTQASGKSYPSVYSYVRLELTMAEYNNDKYDYLCRFVEYNAATDAPQPAGANWWETNMQWGNSTATPKNAFRLIGEDNVRGLDGSLQHVFAVPVTRELNYNTSQSSLPTPFGRVTISYWLVFASSNSTDYGITVISAAGATPLQTKVSPFRSQAEKTFSLGLTKRTEPVQPT